MIDIVIVGGGPIGIACGLEAQKAGLSYLIIEKGVIVNSLFHYPENMQFFSSSERLEIDQIPFISTQVRPFKNEALEYYRRIVTSHQLHINLHEEVKGVTKLEDSVFKIKTNKASYQASNVIIATGFYDIPNWMGVEGEELPHVRHYYDHPHRYALQKVSVIGASNSAIDAALEIYRKGGDVTLLVRGSEISDRVKYWVKPDVLNRIAEGSIQVEYNAEINKITETDVEILQNGESKLISSDFVLALTGYQPNFEMLQQFGISLSEDDLKIPTYNEETMESNIENLYLAGVVCGGMNTHLWFIENSIIHADMIIKDILKKKS